MSSEYTNPRYDSGRIHPYHPNMRPHLFLHRCGPLRRAAFVSLLTVTSVIAQESSFLANRGEPMRVPWTCVEDELQSAGMSCDDEPCPIYLELSAVAAKGNTILVAGDLHGDFATLDSILLRSDDAGATWKEPVARMRGDAVEQLQIYDAQHAWAAGETQYPLPRDPFVLTTTDGGVSWTQHPIGEDGAAGAVQRLRFDSLMHGEAIVDSGKATPDTRYAAYESHNGGDTWTQRSAGDRPPALKTGPAEDPDWRIRPAKDGKSWQIEKRSGDAWSVAASFLIEVATCKIDPEKPN